MYPDIFTYMQEAREFDPKLISLVRLKLLAALADLGNCGASLRDLKNVLDVREDLLYMNLEKLRFQGYLSLDPSGSGKRKTRFVTLTPKGLDEWNKIRPWLTRLPDRNRIQSVTNPGKMVAVFRALGFRPDIARHEDLLVAQSLVLLLHFKGIHLGYQFAVTIRGPFSPDLTDHLGTFLDETRYGMEDIQLTPCEKEITRDINRIFGRNPVYLDVGATYAFYEHGQGYDFFEADSWVKLWKPQYSTAQIAVGISKAKEFLFEPGRKDRDELEKETGIWLMAALKTRRGHAL
ncbi:MAG: transcriptional regulator [Methanoregulaceae archaeon]